MKKLAVFITIILMMFCIVAVNACAASTDPIETPQNIRFDVDNNQIMWDEVPFATGGYIFEVDGKAKEISKNYWFTIEDLQEMVNGKKDLPLSTGTYQIRVKALSIDKTYFKDSSWSQPYPYNVVRESGVTYRLINDGAEYEIASFGKASGKVIIFDKHPDGKPITSVGDRAFYACTGLTEIVLGNNIKYIEAYAFTNCTNLAAVTFPKDLVSIGQNAFQNCRALANVELPENILGIGVAAFSGCTNLRSIEIPDSLRIINTSMFASCAGLTEIKFGTGVYAIGSYAFSNCPSLARITIPGTVEYIMDYAFASSGLVDVVLEYGVAKIGDNAFRAAKQLRTISIPNSVSVIGQNAFHSTRISGEYSHLYDNPADYPVIFKEDGKEDGKLLPIDVVLALAAKEIEGEVDEKGEPLTLDTSLYTRKRSDVIYADNWVVGVRDAKTIKGASLKAGTVGISDYAFNKCPMFETLNIVATVNHVGKYVINQTPLYERLFEAAKDREKGGEDVIYIGNDFVGKWVVGTTEDKETDPNNPWLIVGGITLQKNTVGIAGNAFSGSSQITYFEEDRAGTTNHLRTIGEYAFYKCESLTLTIPLSVKFIGEYAFYHASKLGPQILSDDIERIGDYTFFACSALSSIKLPNKLKSIGHSAFFFAMLTDIQLPDSLTRIDDFAFSTIETGSFNEQDVLLNPLDLVLPKSITHIGDYAFAYTNILRSFKSTNLKYIGVKAFYMCYRLEEIDLNEGLIYISNDAFHTTRIRRVILPESLIHLGDGAFATQLESYPTALEYVYIPSKITRIGRYTFINSPNLKTLVIPESITSIGDYAFANCINLESLIISKNIIGLGSSVFFGCKKLTLYCETTIRPDGWSAMFNSRDYVTPEDYPLVNNWDNGNKSDSMRPIVWGCKLSDDKTTVVSFTKRSFSIYNLNGVSLSAPIREGYVFKGWSYDPDATEAEFTQQSIQMQLVMGGPQLGLELYAVWEKIESTT